jgi:uncharacterized protein YndB with AHSA1/START domain
MPLESLRVVAVIPALAEQVYSAWLDGVEHGLMTGAKAAVDAWVGGRHSAYGDYIEGTNLELEPGRRIVQTWRTTEFSPEQADSRLEVRFVDIPGGCEVTIEHTEIPEGKGSRYEEGWHAQYFSPMTRHFSGSANDASPAAPKEAVEKAPTVAPPKKAAPKKAAVKAAPKKAAKKVAKKAAPKKAAKKVAKKVAKKAAPKKVAKKVAKKATKKIKKKALKKMKKAARKTKKRAKRR